MFNILLRTSALLSQEVYLAICNGHEVSVSYSAEGHYNHRYRMHMV